MVQSQKPPAESVLLVCGFPVWDRFGHGTVADTPFFHPQSGLTLMRCSVEAARVYCEKAGCYPAAPQLQDAIDEFRLRVFS